ncbi:MAG: M23 family metallopeptidase [Prevotellaceae bacterium]|jgi:hypothetical protein|nr:M23 family metallopeptidase [Prevotellaceae bacterium]
MAKKQKKSTKLSVWEQLRFRYKLLILNEKTLEEVFHIELSRGRAVLFFGAAVIVVFALMSLFILYTPVKHFLPGASDISVRSRLTDEVLRVDSLARQVYFQDLQIKTMKKIIDGGIPIDSVPKKNKISPEKWKELADTKSARELKFIEDYENGDNFMPTTKNIDKKIIKSSVFFVSPLSVGVVEKSGNGVSIACKEGQRVSAAAAGAATFTAFSEGNGYTIAIQHNDGFLTIYKNLAKIYKNTGEKISAGEAIGEVGAICASKSKTVSPKLLFELWQNGNPVNPLEKIVF